METLGGAILVVGAFLSGSIPWGLILGRAFGCVDLRRVGSHSTGATNALRVLGWRVSLAVLVLDFLKGLMPVVIGRLAGADEWAVGAAGVAAVVGHCWSPWIGFKGGKGMATGGGASIALTPWLVVLLPVIVAIVWRTRFVSLGSISIAILAAIATIIASLSGAAPWAWSLSVVAIAAIILARHESNIKRLLSGTERRFGERAASTPASANGHPGS